MNVVYKYPLPTKPGKFHVNLPKDATIVSIAIQHGEPVMWVLFNQKNFSRPVERTFRFAMTGEEFTEDVIATHGTLLFDNGSFVLHLFEL